jgi:NAD(P)H-dependent FMN reductase
MPEAIMTTAITIISGSHRPKSQSRRVADYLAERLGKPSAQASADVIDLAGNPLPLWEESAWQKDSAHAKAWAPYAAKLRASAGLILISPEWAGMVPPGLKNFLLHMSVEDVAHKPALIVTVSAARGGTHPVNELRVSGYKNNKMVYLPEHIIVRDVEKMLVGPTAATKDDEYIRGRIDYALQLLLAYANALPPVQSGFATGDARYPFGM